MGNIKIDEEKCMGCGACTAICPEVFEMGKNNKAKIKKGKENSEIQCIEEAIAACPAQAISKEE